MFEDINGRTEPLTNTSKETRTLSLLNLPQELWGMLVISHLDPGRRQPQTHLLVHFKILACDCHMRYKASSITVSREQISGPAITAAVRGLHLLCKWGGGVPSLLKAAVDSRLTLADRYTCQHFALCPQLPLPCFLCSSPSSSLF